VIPVLALARAQRESLWNYFHLVTLDSKVDLRLDTSTEWRFRYLTELALKFDY
jgi:hypothetical protein